MLHINTNKRERHSMILCIYRHIVTAMILTATVCACQKDEKVSCSGDLTNIVRPGFWTNETHCRGVEPAYDLVFDDTFVHRFDITISPENYKMMEDDLNRIVWESILPSDLDELESPAWVPINVKYDGDTWTKVGMRWKGHSSLVGAWKSPIKKLSFNLNFDYFEESYPELMNQRFYGFKSLIFANGYTDQSFIREKLASEIFREAGIPVTRNAFTQVYVDFGEGPVYMGLYTFMEDPADKMMEAQFGYYEGHKGNLYKPYGNAARWRNPDEEVITDDHDWWEKDIIKYFSKSTNEDLQDWSDIMRVIRKLHKNRHIPSQWRADLETVFDVQSFIKTLAISQTITYWDSYGCMHHNYYVYANLLDQGRMVWLPWDLGETMSYRQIESCPDLKGVMFDEIVYPNEEAGIDTYWPLIQYVLGDPVYRQNYKNELKRTINGPFAKNRIFPLMEKYHNLIAPYIVGPKAQEAWPYTTCHPHDCSAFVNSLTEGEGALKPHVDARHEAVNRALEN